MSRAFGFSLEVHLGSFRDVTEELFRGVDSHHRNGRLGGRRRRQSCGGRVVRLKERTVSSSADSEGRDEHIHEEDEIEKVRGTVLPEGTLPEYDSLFPVFPLLFDEERVVLLCF